MIIYPSLLFFSFMIYLLSGVFVLRMRPKSPVNRLFAALCLLFGAWSFLYLMAQGADDIAGAWRWYTVSSFSWIAAPAALLHFMLLLSRQGRNGDRQGWLYVALYVPSAVFAARMMTGTLIVAGFERASFGWREIYAPLSPWSSCYFIYASLYVFGGLVILFRRGMAEDHPAMKKQALLIAASGIIASLLIFLFNFLLPYAGAVRVPSLAPILILIWMAGVLIAIVRYRLMRLSPNLDLNSILDTMADSMILFDWDKKIINANPAALRLLGPADRLAEGTPASEIFLENEAFQEISRESLTREKPVHDIDIHGITSGGDRVMLSLSASAAYDKFGYPVGFVTVFRNISELKQAEEKLRFMATHDALTGLPNRLLLIDRFAQSANRAVRFNSLIALMLVDLDNFKTVNDTYGHGVGDLLLADVTARIKRSIRDYDTLARLGGDEFVLLLTDIMNVDEIEIVTSRIMRSFEEPFVLDSNRIYVTLSIGISMFPADSSLFEDLLKFADVAMYRVKGANKNNYHIYSKEMDGSDLEMLSLEESLRSAIEKDEFEVHYQPIIDIDSDMLVAAEALIRLRHPEQGLISPLMFIPLAEKNGLIIPLGGLILKKVCRQLREWLDAGFPPIPVTVNFSPKQFQDIGIFEKITETLREYRIDPRQLVIEITESSAFDDIERSRRTMEKLVDLGIHIIIDDFGASYSSLRLLKQLPLYGLKIDRFFIQNIVDDPGDAAIVKAIISLAHSLGLQVIAEGIESEVQLKYLRRLTFQEEEILRCDSCQGFHLSRPLVSEDLIAFLKSRDFI